MSKKLSRPALVLLIVGQLIVFAVIGALALEVFTRWSIARAVAGNPYVRARVEGGPWPVPTVNYNYDSFVRRWRSRGASTVPLDPPTTAQTWSARAAFFQAEPGTMPEVMAREFGMKGFVLDADGMPLKTARTSYAQSGRSSLADYIGNDVAQEVSDVSVTLEAPGTYSVFSPDEQPDSIGPGWRFLWRAPSGDLVGFIASERRAVSGELLWDIPYLSYKAHATDESGRFRTNNMRYRDDDVVMPKPEGVFRILCIGGSTTEEGNFNDVTYPNLLEERLNAQRGSHDIDVVNCGMSGASTTQHMARLSDHLMMEPDMVVIYLGVNDIVYSQFKDWTNNPAYWIGRQSLWINEHFNLEMLPDADTRDTDLREGLLQRIVDIADAYREHDVEVAVASFAYPDLENLDPDELVYYRHNNREEWGGRYVTFETYITTMRRYNALLKIVCGEEKLAYLPVAENITGGAEYFGDVCHMKNEGIERKAEVIAEHLAPLLPPASGAKNSAPL